VRVIEELGIATRLMGHTSVRIEAAQRFRAIYGYPISAERSVLRPKGHTIHEGEHQLEAVRRDLRELGIALAIPSLDRRDRDPHRQFDEVPRLLSLEIVTAISPGTKSSTQRSHGPASLGVRHCGGNTNFNASS
jgi:hypothetical protein